MSLAKLIHNIQSYRVLSILILSQVVITILASVSGIVFLYSYISNKNEAELERNKSIIFSTISIQQEELRAWKQLHAVEPLKQSINQINKKIYPAQADVIVLEPKEFNKYLSDPRILILPDESSDYSTAYVVVKLPEFNFLNELKQFKWMAVYLLIFLVCSLLYTIVYTHRYIYSPIKNIIEADNLGHMNIKDSNAKAEIHSLFSRIQKYHALKFEHEVSEKYIALAQQVSHDIRSPLAALKVMGQFLQEVPEEKRLLIRSAVQRIEDIANDLAGKKQEQENKLVLPDSGKTSVYLLSSLIDTLISEKRLQFRSKINVNIRTELDAQSYGLFARLPLQQFKRVLSNLINNAVEAFENGGDIVVAMQNAGDNVVITVLDNGKGIPDDVLPKLMQRGVTIGKADGKGLGLFHARESVEGWGGKIEIASCQTPHNSPGPNGPPSLTLREGECGGTTVTITLPRHSEPDWFVSELKVSNAVVILDDDNSIHQIWENRLVDAGFKKDKIIHFTTTVAISEWYAQNKNQSPDCLFLLDYEILGDGKTGLDVIAELKIAPQAVLVTSRYEEENVLSRCQELGVKLLPKNLAGFVPIAFENKNEVSAPIEYVLIDDQEMNHSTWQIIGRMKKKNVATFFNSESFFKVAATLDKNVKIYVDSDLGNGVKGEVVSREIADKGFSEIYLCTGFLAKSFGPMPWVKEIVGKKPPFLG